jgi:hypothetical protein
VGALAPEEEEGEAEPSLEAFQDMIPAQTNIARHDYVMTVNDLARDLILPDARGRELIPRASNML